MNSLTMLFSNNRNQLLLTKSDARRFNGTHAYVRDIRRQLQHLHLILTVKRFPHYIDVLLHPCST